MVVSCCAINCTQKYEKGISFHYFPKDAGTYKKWLIALKRDNFKPNKYSVICGRHFTSDDYEISGWSSRKYLKIDAVPSLFEFPEHLVKKLKHRHSPKKRTATEAELDIITIAETTLGESNVTKKKVLAESVCKRSRTRYCGDFRSNADDYSFEELKVFFNSAKNMMSLHNQRIKKYLQTIRRQAKKIDSLTKLVEKLQQ